VLNRLRQAVELLFGLQVLLGDFVEAVSAFEQVVGELEVCRAFDGQQAAATGLLRLDRLLRYGFLRLRQTFLVDQGLQFLDLAVEALGLLREQVMLSIAQILQLAVAGQFLTTQWNQRIQRRQFGVQLIALFGGDGFTRVLAGFEDVVDLLDARLAGGNLCLRTFRTSLRGDDQAVGVGQGFLQITLLGRAIGEDLLQLLNRLFGKTLRHRYHRVGFEAGQLAGVFNGLLGCSCQLLLEIDQSLFVITLIVQLSQRALQGGLQGLFIGIRQFAVGQLVEAGLHSVAGRWFGGVQRADSKTQAQQGRGEKGAQGRHRDRSSK